MKSRMKKLIFGDKSFKSQMHFTAYVKWAYKKYCSYYVNSFFLFLFFFIHFIMNFYFYYNFEIFYFVSIRNNYKISQIILILFDLILILIFFLSWSPKFKFFFFKKFKFKNKFFFFFFKNLENIVNFLIFFLSTKFLFYFFFIFLTYYFWTPRFYVVFKYNFLIDNFNIFVLEYFLLSQNLKISLFELQQNYFHVIISNRFLIIFFFLFIYHFINFCIILFNFFLFASINGSLLLFDLFFGNGIFDLIFFFIETYYIAKITTWEIILYVISTIDDNFRSLTSSDTYFFLYLFYILEWLVHLLLFFIESFI